jgi:lipoate-protein ligase A
MQSWRFLPYTLNSAAANMACDEAILDAVAEGDSTPTLRIYGFEPGAVSIGLNQELEPDQIARMQEAGLDIVRRPTGGRAVLHLNELTYSFVGTADFLSTSVIRAYKQICGALILAFESLGVPVQLGSAGASYRDFQDCFLATTSSDLHYQGFKIAGSAQLRRRHAILQHGSILLNQDQHLMSRLLDPASDQKGKRHANLNEILGREVSIDELSAALKSGFEKAFEVSLSPGSLSAAELSCMQETAVQSGRCPARGLGAKCSEAAAPSQASPLR